MKAFQKKKKPAKKISAQTQKKDPGTRFTIDDPVNDVHDDELYDDETGLKKEPPSEPESFERPW